MHPGAGNYIHPTFLLLFSFGDLRVPVPRGLVVCVWVLSHLCSLAACLTSVGTGCLGFFSIWQAQISADLSVTFQFLFLRFSTRGHLTDS